MVSWCTRRSGAPGARPMPRLAGLGHRGGDAKTPPHDASTLDGATTAVPGALETGRILARHDFASKRPTRSLPYGHGRHALASPHKRNIWSVYVSYRPALMGIVNIDDELHDQLRKASAVSC